MSSKLDYFPFISGELLEQHRQGLTGQMRADLQNYLMAKSSDTYSLTRLAAVQMAVTTKKGQATMQ